MNRPADRIAPVADPAPADDEPVVWGLLRTDEGLALGRRAFFGGLAAGSVAATSAACSTPAATPVANRPDPGGAAATSRPAPAARPPTVPTATTPPRIEARRCATVGLRSHTAAVSALAFDASGRWLVSASSDRSAKLWSVAERSVGKTLQADSAITAIALAADASRLITTGGAGSLQTWGLPEGRAGAVQRGPSAITALALAPDGRHLAVGSAEGTIQLLAQPDGRLLLEWRAHGTAVRGLVFAPDGRTLVSAEGHEPIRLWAVPSGTAQGTLGQPPGPGAPTLGGINTIALSGDGALLASGGRTDAVKLWSIAEQRLLRQFSGGPYNILALALSPDGRQLAAGGSDHDVRLWATREAGAPLRLAGHADNVWSLAFSPDGAWLASGSADQSAMLWPMPISDANACLWDEAATERGTQVNRIRQMGASTLTLPCDAPLPAGAICLCDCVAASHTYRGTQTVCTCDTVVVPSTAPLPAGSICTCNTVAVGGYTRPAPPAATRPVPSGHERRSSGSVCTCDTICTCNTISTGRHYWRPN